MAKLYVVDESGEVVRELHEEDRIIDHKKLDNLERKVRVDYYYVKVNAVLMAKLIPKYPMIARLLPYIGVRDNLLIYQNGLPITLMKMPDLLGIKYDTCSRSLKRLEDAGIIKKVNIKGRKKGVVFNYWIAMKGTVVSMSTYQLFENSKYRYDARQVER